MNVIMTFATQLNTQINHIDSQYDQVTKSSWRMPWGCMTKKVVVSCEKLRVGANIL